MEILYILHIMFDKNLMLKNKKGSLFHIIKSTILYGLDIESDSDYILCNIIILSTLNIYSQPPTKEPQH